MVVAGRRPRCILDQAPIRDSLVDQATEWREKLIEAAVEQDDDAMEAYLEGTEA